MTAEVEARFEKPRGEVFDQFVEADRLVRWWATSAVTDPVAGGTYEMFFAGPEVTLRGTYLEVRRPEFLSFTWSWDHENLPERLVEITFGSNEGDTSSVLVRHEASDEAETSSYREGWEYFLGRLGTVLDG